VRTDGWKLIRYPTGDGTPDRFTAELYDLREDPYELRNLIDDAAHAADRQRLERLFEEVSARAGTDLMPVYEGIVHVRPDY
jgi:arylsulfatase A-like enzyme